MNHDVESWNVTNVEKTPGMFGDYNWGVKGLFNQNIGEWNVSKVRFMSGMFYFASAFNQDLAGWNVSKVSDFSYMFYGATAFNQSLCDWYKYFSSDDQPDVYSMFSQSGCPLKIKPNFQTNGYFCQKCNQNDSRHAQGAVIFEALRT
jgi:surface protein